MDNLDTSLLSLYGDFQQGAFHTEDNSLQLTNEQKGQWLCFDGTKPHYSTTFPGTRYSIVASQHSTTSSLPPAQLQALLDLGFQLPPASGPLKLQGEIDGKIDGEIDIGTEAEAGAKRNGTEARGERQHKTAKAQCESRGSDTAYFGCGISARDATGE